MAIAKKRIHMICGFCGSDEHLSYTIDPRGRCDNDGTEHSAVFVTCKNCTSGSSLDEVIKEEIFK